MKRIVLQSDTKMYGVTVMEGWKKMLGAIMKWKAVDKQCVKEDDCCKNEDARKLFYNVHKEIGR